jgi:hypothetical protein
MSACPKCGTEFDPEVTTEHFQHENTDDVPLHTLERCLTVQLEKLKQLVQDVRHGRNVIEKQLAVERSRAERYREALYEYERVYQINVERSRMPKEDGAFAGYAIAAMLSGRQLALAAFIADTNKEKP